MDVEPDVKSYPYMKHVNHDDKGWIPATWQGTGTYHDREALIFPSHKNKDKVVNMGVMFNRLLKEINLDSIEKKIELGENVGDLLLEMKKKKILMKERY